VVSSNKVFAFLLSRFLVSKNQMKNHNQKKMSITLTQTPLEKECDQISLGELLEETLEVVDPQDFAGAREANWIVRNAIRAVCEEIIRVGELTAPIEVRFARSGMFRRRDYMRFRASRN
jgi:hypothetical protein